MVVRLGAVATVALSGFECYISASVIELVSSLIACSSEISFLLTEKPLVPGIETSFPET
jgi:hypothetical protein